MTYNFMREYSLDDVIYSIIEHYPGMSQQIFSLAYQGRQEAQEQGLSGKELIDYVDSYIKEELD